MMYFRTSQMVSPIPAEISQEHDPAVAEAGTETPSRVTAAAQAWACLGSWLCLCIPVAILTPMVLIEQAASRAEWHDGAKPLIFRVADAVAFGLPYLPALATLGAALAIVGITLGPRRYARAGYLALAMNLCIALMIRLGT